MENEIIEVIKELKKHLSEAELAYDEPFKDEFEQGAAFGRIESYEHCIALLSSIVKKEYKNV